MFEWGYFYDFNDNAIDDYPLIEVVKAVEKVKQKYSPTLDYTHSGADLSVDHRVVANAVLTAFRPQPNEQCKEMIEPVEGKILVDGVPSNLINKESWRRQIGYVS